MVKELTKTRVIDKIVMKKMLYNAVDIIEEIINIESIILIDYKFKKIIIKIKKEIDNI